MHCEQLREALAAQLGIDPSPQLSRLEHDILIQSPDLDGAGAAATGAPGLPTWSSKAFASPSNLPAPVARFVGSRVRV
jgi:DNA-binding SARP family transcriptional activator